MLDLEGLAPSAQECAKLRHPGAGGVILFSRNYESRAQLKELVREIRAIRGPDFLIAVDQEGGRVQRFRKEFTRLPPAARYGGSNPQNLKQSTELAENAGWLMAAELLSIGLDFSFAPVLDVDCGISSVIGDRAFATHPQVVAELASAFRRGMRAAGMAAVGKHFPGHGGVASDSHLELPVDQRPFDEINARDLIPFRRLISEGIEAIMPAHVVYARVDDQPAGFSSHWVSKVLRGDLGFDGVIFSDDLSMSGAEFAGGFADRLEAALNAGCDMALICNQAAAAESVLDLAAARASAFGGEKLRRMRACPTFDPAELASSARWRLAVDCIQPNADC